MSDIGGGTEALRGFPSLLSIDPLQTMNRPRSLAYKQTNLSYNTPYDGSPTIDYHLDVLISVGGFVICGRIQFCGRALSD